jgi:predicted membrane chloride channel (bestrophin family)
MEPIRNEKKNELPLWQLIVMAVISLGVGIPLVYMENASVNLERQVDITPVVILGIVIVVFMVIVIHNTKDPSDQ